jgi:hypothetical protein
MTEYERLTFIAEARIARQQEYLHLHCIHTPRFFSKLAQKKSGPVVLPTTHDSENKPTV